MLLQAPLSLPLPCQVGLVSRSTTIQTSASRCYWNSVAPHANQAWQCPSHHVAALPTCIGKMVNPYCDRPGWFNNPATCAVLPNCTQLGATCGLHGFCHLLYNAGALRCASPMPTPPNRAEFEATGLASKHGDSPANLVQPGGSNYDIAVLMSSFSHHRLHCFPLDADELQGTSTKICVLPGGRFRSPFAPYVLPASAYDCVGYLLRIPSHGGHWIAIVPKSVLSYNPAHPTTICASYEEGALLCDSLYPCPFLISLSELECLLTAVAVDTGTRNPSQFQGKWGCFLIGDGSTHTW